MRAGKKKPGSTTERFFRMGRQFRFISSQAAQSDNGLGLESWPSKWFKVRSLFS